MIARYVFSVQEKCQINRKYRVFFIVLAPLANAASIFKLMTTSYHVIWEAVFSLTIYSKTLLFTCETLGWPVLRFPCKLKIIVRFELIKVCMHADFQLVFKMKNSIFNKFKLLKKKSKKIDLYKLTIDNYEVFFQFQYRSPKID